MPRRTPHLAQRRLARTRTLTQPVLLLAQDGAFEFEAACYTPGATDVTGTAIPGAGHWLDEEDPDAVLAQFRPFFGGGS